MRGECGSVGLTWLHDLSRVDIVIDCFSTVVFYK